MAGNVIYDAQETIEEVVERDRGVEYARYLSGMRERGHDAKEASLAYRELLFKGVAAYGHDGIVIVRPLTPAQARELWRDALRRATLRSKVLATIQGQEREFGTAAKHGHDGILERMGAEGEAERAIEKEIERLLVDGDIYETRQDHYKST